MRWFIARDGELLIFRWVSSGQKSLSQKLLNVLLKSTLLWNGRDVCYGLCFTLDALSDLKQVTLLFCTCFTYSDFISVLYVLIILCAGTVSWNPYEWPQCSMPTFDLEHMEAISFNNKKIVQIKVCLSLPQFFCMKWKLESFLCKAIQ